MVAIYVPGSSGPIVFANSGGAAYSGPGDIVSGALAWYGCRGYSAAYSTGSNPAMDVVDTATGLITTTVNILSNGNLDTATILGLGYGVSVKKLYDQTGNGNDISQATLANMPVLTPSAIGSLPAMTFTRTSAHRLARASIAQAQPWTISAVANRSTNPTQYGGILTVQNNLAGLWFRNIADNLELDAQSALTKASVTDGSWHAIQAIANGASSIIDADNNSTTGNAGTSAIAGGATMTLGGSTNALEYLGGLIAEAGLWPSAFTGGDITNMSANQHSYWGF